MRIGPEPRTMTLFKPLGKKSVIVFEPSEEMVDYIKHYLPYGAYQEN